MIADSIIWLGRRTAYLGDYKKAIEIFTKGIKKFPKDARLFRHRGHRFITIRCFDDAIKDFETAAKLVKGKADEIEPDGLPNARNIPTSTLQSNIFYHLGLAYYVKGDFKNALNAYRKAEKVSTNPDMLVATKHWLYMTLRRLGREKEAEKSISDIKDNLDIIENDDYYKLIKLYQGKIKVEDLQKEIGAEADTLGNASLGYGLGNWFFYNGEKEKGENNFSTNCRRKSMGELRLHRGRITSLKCCSIQLYQFINSISETYSETVCLPDCAEIKTLPDIEEIRRQFFCELSCNSRIKIVAKPFFFSEIIKRFVRNKRGNYYFVIFSYRKINLYAVAIDNRVGARVFYQICRQRPVS